MSSPPFQTPEMLCSHAVVIFMDEFAKFRMPILICPGCMNMLTAAPVLRNLILHDSHTSSSIHHYGEPCLPHYQSWNPSTPRHHFYLQQLQLSSNLINHALWRRSNTQHGMTSTCNLCPSCIGNLLSYNPQANSLCL